MFFSDLFFSAQFLCFTLSFCAFLFCFKKKPLLSDIFARYNSNIPSVFLCSNALQMFPYMFSAVNTIRWVAKVLV
ncbi:uncharacterized protein EV154DRAFT_509229 [Mucor mucedo]|uniref:uncharacterized protein n=1 Tax=Mucor mucedo TaxID=29922 RepID=UPI00221EDC99|nr:uncharacterized protein EV154DRAFT_509229 [Mucor mucedo]KAI7891118.1 hypothetical protein EV154DRAFT_509229 [Mucor mucedo]